MIKILQMLNHDPDFRRGFRRGAGLTLAGWVIVQCPVCALWSTVVRWPPSLRLALGWAMIAVGCLGMTVHFWITTTWLWYLLRRERQPFWEWFKSIYAT